MDTWWNEKTLSMKTATICKKMNAAPRREKGEGRRGTLPKGGARSTQHAARRTQHAARSTQHAARSTQHAVRKWREKVRKVARLLWCNKKECLQWERMWSQAMLKIGVHISARWKSFFLLLAIWWAAPKPLIICGCFFYCRLVAMATHVEKKHGSKKIGRIIIMVKKDMRKRRRRME